MNRFNWSSVATVVALLVAAGGSSADDKAEAIKKELKTLEGNWKLVRQEQRGSLTPKPIVANLRIVIEENQISWYIGNPASNQDADVTLDPAKTPKTIDAEITKGSAKDKIMRGIYKLEGDTLEICWGEPGGEKRPTKFASRPGVGSGNVYEKYQREKE